ncbi:MAG: lmo0937 family membrane protein [Dehalococcoidia bacterium]|jgi:hypothetical protein
MSIILIIAAVIFVLWLLGFIFFRTLGWFIHLALIIAVILLIWWLLTSVFKLF